MLFVNESDFARHIKNADVSNVYFIFGDENYAKGIYVDRICQKAVLKEAMQFNYSKFDGRNTSIDEISDACEALPLMSDLRCVVVEDLDIEKLSSQEYQKLKELLKNPCDTTVLIFVTRSFEVNERRSQRYKTFIDAVSKNGVAAKLNKRSTKDIVKFIRVTAQKNGCTIDDSAAMYLSNRCCDDMVTVSNELSKLCAYCKEREITKQDIEKCGMIDINANIFDISKAIVRGDYNTTMKKLRELVEINEEPVAILSVLSSAFVDMYRAKAAVSSNVSQADIVSDFKYKGKEFRVRNALNDCRSFSAENLRNAVSMLAKTDFSLKSTRLDKVITLERTVTQLFIMLTKSRKGKL